MKSTNQSISEYESLISGILKQYYNFRDETISKILNTFNAKSIKTLRDRIEAYKWLNVSNEQLNSILFDYPELININSNQIYARANFLQQSLNVNIQKDFPRWPKIMLKTNDQTNTLIGRLESSYNFSHDEAIETVSRNAFLLSYTTTDLSRREKYFKSENLSHENFSYLLKRRPSFITADVDSSEIEDYPEINNESYTDENSQDETINITQENLQEVFN